MKNNSWTPISTGLLPDDMEDVQVTYIDITIMSLIVMHLRIEMMEIGIGR